MLHPRTRVVLELGGWTPNRAAHDYVAHLERSFFSRQQFRLNDAARSTLLALGGLSFEQKGPGQTVARESFHFDPTACWAEHDRIGEFARALGTELCPVGEAHSEYSFMTISPSGQMVCLMEIGWVMGESVEQGLNALVLGIQGREIDVEDEHWG